MSEATIGLPPNPFDVALGVTPTFVSARQNAYQLPGDVAQANALAPVIGSAPPPTPGQFAAAQLPVGGGTIIQKPGVDGLGRVANTQQYFTGLDLVQVGAVDPSNPGPAGPDAEPQ